jgi:hypothetical protein
VLGCAFICVTRFPALGGLEGLQPSKNHSFLVMVAGKAGNHHQKNGDIEEASLPKPLYCVSLVVATIVHENCGNAI